MNRNRALCALTLLGMSLAGCGGGTSSVTGSGSGATATRQTGYFKVIVNWPDATTSKGANAASRTRLIPSNTTRIVVTVHDGSPGTGYQQQTLTRPANSTPAPISTAAFVLPVNDPTSPSWPVDVQEYADPSNGLSNVVIAEAHSSIAVTKLNTISNPATVSISPTSDVKSLVETGPTQVSGNLGPYSLSATDSIDLNATAYNGVNGTGDIVPIPSNSISYSSDASSVASVTLANNIGTVTANTYGTANITAKLTYPTTGTPVVFTSNAIAVSVGLKVIVTPATATLAVNATTSSAFVATVVGGTTNSVTWSVDEGAAGGTVTSGGLYTAPATRGTYHVRATSTLDTAQSGVATVTVQAGTANVNIN